MRKAGTIETKTTDVTILFSPTKRGPIDANTRITSLSNIDTELPNDIRTTGYLYFVEDIETIYIFIGGTTNMHFKPISEVLNTGRLDARIGTLSLSVGNNIVEHGFNKTLVSLQVRQGTQTVLVDWQRGDESENDTNNKFTIISDADVANCDLLMVFM